MSKQIELNPGNNSMIHFLQRHRDMFYDYSKDYKKYKVNIVIYIIKFIYKYLFHIILIIN